MSADPAKVKELQDKTGLPPEGCEKALEKAGGDVKKALEEIQKGGARGPTVDSGKVKELREKTGLPMMECKRALEKTGGDVEKAYDELRKAGLKAQEKLAGRAANEGRTGSGISADGETGVLAALRCETESVGKTETFQKLLSDIVQAILEKPPANTAALEALPLPSGLSVKDSVTDLVNRIRENISIGRCARFEGDAVVQYVHFDGKKAAMVALQGGSIKDPRVVEIGKEICMHIVFSNLSPETTPQCLSRAEFDPRTLEREREILLATAKNDLRNAKKPEEILKKIIEGQVDKFVAARCLLEQPFIKDPKQTVEAYLKASGTGVKITHFVYVATDVS
ncbi:MAG TPA: translation elongation factor Ts [Planctomycetota bacterium]|nr:translation elongation factor Ts [Planctomycetota bacterium]